MNHTPKMVRVEWVDSSSVHSTAWGDIEEAINGGLRMIERPCVSVGFLVSETEDALVLVPHLSGWPLEVDDVGSGDMTIPKSAVKRMVEIG